MGKRLILAGLAAAAAVLIVNGLIYPFYHDFLRDNSDLAADLFDRVQRPVDETLLPATAASMVLVGALIAVVVRWSGAHTFLGGIKAGLVLGLLMVGTVNLGLIATTHYYSYTSGIVDAFVGGATIAVGGGAAALVLGKRDA